MEKQRKNVRPYVIAAAVSFVIGAVIFCLFFFLKSRSISAAVDGTSYAGIILITLSLFIMIARFGFFDIFSYGFKQLGASMFNKQASKYNDFPGYKQEMNAVRERRSKYFLSMLSVGALYLVAAIILLLILRSM